MVCYNYLNQNQPLAIVVYPSLIVRHLNLQCFISVRKEVTINVLILFKITFSSVICTSKLRHVTRELRFSCYVIVGYIYLYNMVCLELPLI